MNTSEAKEMVQGIVMPLIVAVLVSGGSSWLGVKIGLNTLEVNLKAVEQRIEELEGAREIRRSSDRETRDLLIRIDQKVSDIDRRTQKLEARP